MRLKGKHTGRPMITRAKLFFRISLIFGLLFATPSVAQTVKQLAKNDNYRYQYIAGAVRGWAFANEALVERGQPPLFCLNSTTLIGFGAEEAERFIMNSNETGFQQNDQSLELILDFFRMKYPCK